MTRCSHCGREHPPETTRCPVTRAVMARPGPIGTSVDRYQLEFLLGSGGFGSVYRARHVHTEQQVALKTLNRQLSQDPQMVERFLREAKAAASVGNEHIVRIHDAGLTPEGIAFLAMELLDGVDVKELASRSGPLAPRRLVDLICQVLDGLEAAHQQGIVHRDLKPANVYVVQKGGADFVKLLDFGISKMRDSGEKAALTMTGLAMGTPGYMAPEQFFDAKGVDARADVYSVGAMAYELFAGRLPIEAQSYPEMIMKVQTEVPPPLASLVPALPPAVCAAVDKALARSAADRWPSARAFSDALAAGGSLSDALPVAAAGPAARATPMPSGAPSMLYGATAVPAPAPATPQAQGAAPQAPPASAPAPEPQPSFGGPLMPPPQPASKSKKNPVFWAIVVIGALTVLTGGCCAFGAVAQALNDAGGTDTVQE
jgi:serine/threonine protein kinase